MEPLRPGQPGPDFTLNCTPDQTLSLNEFRGRRVITWSCLSPIGINPGADGIVAALEAMDREQVPQ